MAIHQMAVNRLLCLSLLCMSAGSYGGVYKCTDRYGGIVYSDTECATRADRQPVNTASSPAVGSLAPSAPKLPHHPAVPSVSELMDKVQGRLKDLGGKFGGGSANTVLPGPVAAGGGLDANNLDVNSLDVTQLTQVLQALQALQCGDNAACLDTVACNEAGVLMGLCTDPALANNNGGAYR